MRSLGTFCLMFAVLGLQPAKVLMAADAAPSLQLAQAMIPPTGMTGADKDMAAQERMRRRYPQPVRVKDLIGLRVIDNDDRTLGFVRQVVRTPQNAIELVVDYGGWFGWNTRPVAVPIEVVGMLGREISSLDMPRSEYIVAPTWRADSAVAIPRDDSISVALARR
jgi:hypothetical protein